MTGNPGKLAEARRLCGAALESVAIDLPEVQSLDLERVLAAKGEEAWRRLGRPLLVEESGLELAALGGFPGPLVRWMEEAAGVDRIATVAHALGDPAATARCALLYVDRGERIVGRGAVAGALVTPPRGSNGFGWDTIFVPDGGDRTYAEMSAAEKDRDSHRTRAWADLLSQL